MATLTVTNTNDSGSGSLRRAVTDAVDGDTINITATGTLTLGSELPVITKSATIIGPGAHLLTISGRNALKGFEIGTPTVALPFPCNSVSISNLTIAAGAADVGAGILFTGCKGTSAPTGESSLTVTNVAFSGNNADVAGGGIYTTGLTIVTNCTFSGNSGGSRNGVFANGGGAIYTTGSLTVTNSTFSGNRAGSNVGPVPSSGGAINAFNNNGTGLTVINSTFTGNLACGYNGGAIFANNLAGLVLKNTIIAGDCGFAGEEVTISASPVTASNNLFGSPVPGVNNGVNGNIVTAAAAALLGPLGDYGGQTQTIPLLPGSPAIAAGGTGSGIPRDDQRGAPRYGNMDIGAFESQGFTLAIVSGNNQIGPTGSAFTNPLQVSVSGIGPEPVNGGQVTFTPPANGASSTVTGTPATITGGTATTGFVMANVTIGSYNVTANAKGASAAVNFALTNVDNTTIPTFTPAATIISRQQGLPAGAAVLIGTVADGQSPASSLTVTQIGGGTAGGITATSISNTNGMITAQVSAGCNATAGTVRFQVSDGALTSTGDLQVDVTLNPAPMVGVYPDTSIAPGGNTTVTPSSAPSDNGTIVLVRAATPGFPSIFTGAFFGNTTTGAITITGANPPGNYAVTVVVSDNCGIAAVRSFRLTVGTPPNSAPTFTPAAAVTLQQGSPAGAAVTVGTAADGQTAAGSLTVTQIAGGSATGITVTSITNSGGAITALVSASCTAAAGTVRFQVSDGSLTGTGDLTVNVTAAPAPNITTQPAVQTVCAGSAATFTVTAANAMSYQWRKGGVDISGATASSYTTPATTTADNAALYSVVITGICGTSVTSSAATLSVNATTAITTQPTNQTACLGGAVSFSVAATGANLTYQWRKGGAAIGGATSATYNIAAVTAGDAASYDVIVTGACGTLTSSAATLTINPATSVNTQPQNQTVCVGAAATFTVAASGAGTVTYQWRKGGVAINGATAASFTINPVAAGDAGSYDVLVSSGCGTLTSSAATLAVNTTTAISSQPQNATVCAGAPASFSVAATGTNLTYQWRKGGVAIGGATSATYSIGSVVAGDAASYDVVVTGACGAATSSVAQLTVNPATVINTQPAS